MKSLNSEDEDLAQWLTVRLAEERHLLEARHKSLLDDFREHQLARRQEHKSSPLPTPNNNKTALSEPVSQNSCSSLKSARDVGDENTDIDDKMLGKSGSELVAFAGPHSKSHNHYHAHTPLGKLVMNRNFELFFAALIGINMVAMAAEMEYRGNRIGSQIGYADYSDVTGYWSDVFSCLDWIFGFLYTVELLLKLVGLRRAFFEPWNVFDAIVVAIFYFEKIALAGIPVDMMILRLFRLLKVLRLLRLVHELVGFGQLLLMVTALQGCMRMLAWATLLLLGLQSICAFLLNQLLNEFVVTNENMPDATRSECFRYFGTFARAIFSMFELTLGNWIPISRFLLEDVHIAFVAFALVFKLTLGFAVVGVVNACFIKETFKTISTDRTMMVIEKDSEKKTFEREMMKFLQHADTSKDGSLTRTEFIRVCQDESVKTWLAAQGLDASNAGKLFTLMDDGSGELEFYELVKGVAKLKGPAKSLDFALARTEHIAEENLVLKRFADQNLLLKSLQDMLSGLIQTESLSKSSRISQLHISL